MLEKLKKNWVLVIIGVLLVIVALIFLILRQGTSTGTQTASTSATPVADEQNQYASLPQGSNSTNTGGSGAVATPTSSASVTKSKTPIAATSPTPSPTATGTVGYLDWSQNLSHFETTEVTLSAEDTAKLSSGDYCTIAGLSDDWSDPFGKTMCGLARFVGNQIVEPLDKIACQLEIATYNLNFSSNITGHYENGLCLIEDR